MRRLLILFVTTFIFLTSTAKEGMWVPTLLDKYNIDEMQEMGFRLTAEDIYSINQNSLKDAIVIFGKGCTGEMISEQGLLLTNHHCGFSSIQSHSSLEHDYLTDGFWAMSQNEELPNPGLTAKFLDRMVDVSNSVFTETDSLQGDVLQQKINSNINQIQKNASEDGKFEAVVKPLFFGNQYFLYVYKVYTDVRLVGTPPVSIGKFGGDTDNWMWPRHTGDFSVFRVYADKNNEPAPFSETNVPYHPKKVLPISLEGIQPNDFVMIMGYPGSTRQYLPSQAVKMLMDQSNPERIKIRTAKLNAFAKHMKADPNVRIQYASKYAKTSNSWKRWKGEIKGLERMQAIKQKQAFEANFEIWYLQNDSLKNKYDQILPQFEKLYLDLYPFDKAYQYYQEIVFRGIDIFDLASMLPQNKKQWAAVSEDQKELLREVLRLKVQDFYDDFDLETDQDVFVDLLRILRDNLDPGFLPSGFTELFDQYDNAKIIRKIYQRSVLPNPAKMKELISSFDEKTIDKLQKDPLMKLYHTLKNHYERTVENVYKGVEAEIQAVQKHYMQGILAMEKNERLYPDANFTMRIAYGKVEGYQPRDGVQLNYYTTLKGVMEKADTANPDYQVPQKLKDLYQAHDFGEYESKRQLPLAYTASIHTTGGNSGSPALNANGELVGLNFDRCWEGTMSDIMFDPDQCRNIMLDTRYILFIIDKFAGAGYLLNEMEIVRKASTSEVINQ